jgi:hypothetical protein
VTTTAHPREGSRRRAATVLALLSTGLVMAGTAAGPARAAVATTPLTTESFSGTTTDEPGWFLPAPGTNEACLTAGLSASQLPIPACSSSFDPAGSGVLQLTSNSNEQVGNVYNSVSLPTSRGLDIAFDTFQYAKGAGVTDPVGADGISFILAATDPADPAPPGTQGATGGSLGYSASKSLHQPGVSYGYLGFGIDVYGNFTNGDFGGTNCTDVVHRGSPNVAVRGPGNGMKGYCLLASQALSAGDLDKQHETERPAPVHVEVAVNPSASTVLSSAGLTVPPTSFTMRVTSYLSGQKVLTQALPTIDDALGFPADWINPATGLPYQLTFGWGASTGGSNEKHEIGELETSTLTGQLPVYGLDIAGGPVPRGTGSAVSVTPRLTAGQGAEGEATVVRTTFPAGLTPRAGSFTTANGYACTTTGQTVACSISPTTPFGPGAALPAVVIPVDVPLGTALGGQSVTAKVSSLDAMPATATGTVTVVEALPSAPTGLTAVPDASSVAVSWQPPASGQPAVRYRVTASPGSATCTTTGTTCLLGGVAGQGYTITVTPVTADGVEGTPATVTTTGTVVAPQVPATPPADAPLTLTTTDGPITTATPGQQITVIGTGFLPYSTVTIAIYSTPVVLGTVTTDGSGAFSKLVTVPTDLAAGVHALVAYGVDPAGLAHAIRMDVTVAAAVAPTPATPTSATPAAAAGPGTGGLAYTGSTFDPTPVVVGGSVLLLTGALLLVGLRRRRSGTSPAN